MNPLLSKTCALLLAVTTTFAAADSVRYYPLDQTPTPIEFARALMGPDFKPNHLMRGVRAAASEQRETPIVLADAQAATAGTLPRAVRQISPNASAGPVIVAAANAPAQQAEPVKVITPTVTQLAIPIPFAFNSARLAGEAKPSLNEIAEGIKLIHTTQRIRIVIEGHTDAKGTSAYNLRLSQRRAAAVKQYLVHEHGIDPRLLRAVGRGERQPLNQANPYADENRRVQFSVA